MTTTSEHADNGAACFYEPLPASLTDWLASFKAALIRNWAVFKGHGARRRAEAEFLALDARTLRDIGVGRSEISRFLLYSPGPRRNYAQLCRMQDYE